MTEEGRGREELVSELTQLWTRFRPKIDERVDVLESAAIALLGGELAAEPRRRAEREAHKLAGLLGTFGLTEGSRHARSMELLLEGSATLQESSALQLSESVVALRGLIEQPVAAASRGGAEGKDAVGERPVLAVSTDDADLAERVEMEASARGFAISHSASGAPVEGAPAAVVLDLLGTASHDRYAGLEALNALPGAPPVVVVASQDGLGERVEAVRRGARAFLPRPVSPIEVVDAVERALLRRSAAGADLLVVDDDPQMLTLLESLLTGRGMRVHAVKDAASFWRELGRVQPDLVVLDVDMPGLDGVDLCRALRSDARWETLPVLFLSGRIDPASVGAIFAAGADDYVAKPVVGAELLMRIENRLERARLLGAARDATGPAGLPGRSRSVEQLARLLQLAGRAGAGAAVARVNLDNLEELSARLGAAAADEARKRVAQLLRARTAPGDVVGWWGADTLALGLFATDRDTAVKRLLDAQEILAREGVATPDGELRVGLRAGVAMLPDDGSDPPGLVAAAEQALARTRDENVSVLAHRVEAGGGPAEVVDVALVEDDAVLAELILHALTVQGYSSRWLPDGGEAAERLAGHNPSLRARVVLLDVDLPGRDGLNVLRDLARDHVVEHTQVVMLTARSTEREVLMALELGAVDHVAKPFSVPVLMRRVRGLLERG